mmetsp:Transcript_17120/g.46983  ORF Transcript_17120/g.46983 Transcript_17120/m.46983 type:complete len:134 (-) Transcript_17120:1806-2207(-)
MEVNADYVGFFLIPPRKVPHCEGMDQSDCCGFDQTPDLDADHFLTTQLRSERMDVIVGWSAPNGDYAVGYFFLIVLMTLWRSGGMDLNYGNADFAADHFFQISQRTALRFPHYAARLVQNVDLRFVGTCWKLL